MFIRAYAFAGRKRAILILLSVCYAGLIALNVWVYCFRTTPLPRIWYTIVGNTGCFPNYMDKRVSTALGVSHNAFISHMALFSDVDIRHTDCHGKVVCTFWMQNIDMLQLSTAVADFLALTIVICVSDFLLLQVCANISP